MENDGVKIRKSMDNLYVRKIGEELAGRTQALEREIKEGRNHPLTIK